MGTKKLLDTQLSVFPWPPSSTALTAENGSFVLFVQPPEEFPKTSVGQDGFHRIERSSKLVMTPRLVDEILAGNTDQHDLLSAFAAGHYVMSTCRNFSFTKHTGLGHKNFGGSIANQC